MRINLNFRPSFDLKKLIIIFLLILCIFGIKDKVFAASINLYDYISDDSLQCGRNNGSNFLEKWYFEDYDYSNYSSGYECTWLSDNNYTTEDFINHALDRGYRYILIQELTTKNFSTDYKATDYLIYFFRKVPTVQVIHSSNSITDSTRYQTVGYSGTALFLYLDYYSNLNDNYINYKYFNDLATIEVSSTQYTDNTKTEVHFMSGSHIITNFDLYDTDGNLIEGSSSIGFMSPTPGTGNPYSQDVLSQILNAILSIPSNIAKFFINLANSIGNFFSNLIDFIHDFFIPNGSQFQDFLNDEYNYVRGQLGFLFYPIELVTDFITRFNNIPNTQTATFNIPEVSFMGIVVIHATSFELLSFVNSSTALSYLYSLYRIIVSFLIVAWICKLAYKKFNETLGGGYK